MKKNKTCFSKSTALAVICLFLFSSCSSENKDVQTTSAEITTVATTSPKIEEPTSEDEPIKWAEYISDSYVELIDYTQTESDNGKYNISICAVADLATNPELTVKNLYKQSRLIFRQFKKCRTLDMLSVSFVDEQDNSKVYMSYDISKKKISSQKVDDEKWDGYSIPEIADNFKSDSSLSDSLKRPFDFKKASDLLGRGQSDSGRSEPDYVGICGYVAIGWQEKEIMEKSDDPSVPCSIPIYQKHGVFSEIGSVENNTEIGVISQELTHSGWGTYDGYLFVQDKEGEQFYINVDNFVTKPYYDY